MFKLIIYLIITIIILHFILYYFNFDFNKLNNLKIFNFMFSIKKINEPNLNFSNGLNDLDSIQIPETKCIEKTLLNDYINELKTLNQCINNGKIDTSFS